MDIKIFKNFVEIVESGSLTAASKKLFIAQPALSNQLKALEKEMGAVLIERNSRHQKLTDAGRIFYERAKGILLLESSMAKEIGDCEKGEIGTLKVATIPSAEYTMLTEILPDFEKKYPRVRYEFYEKESDYILHLLEDGVVDIGIIRTPCRITPEMDAFYISDENLVLAYREDVFPMPDKESILLEELGDMPLLVIRRYEEMVRQASEECHFHPNLRCVNQQLSINVKWAEEGLGVALVPESSLTGLSSGNLKSKKIAGSPLSTRRAIVTMKNSYHSKAAENFLELCKKKL